MQICELDLDFRIGHCNGTMSLQISFNDKILDSFSKLPNDTLQVKYSVPLPGTLSFKLSGKNMNADTRIDEKGNIVADKYIILENLSLGRFTVPQHTLKKICTYQRIDNITTNDNYWGFPGQVNINFDCSNVVKWHLINTKL